MTTPAQDIYKIKDIVWELREILRDSDCDEADYQGDIMDIIKAVRNEVGILSAKMDRIEHEMGLILRLLNKEAK